MARVAAKDKKTRFLLRVYRVPNPDILSFYFPFLIHLPPDSSPPVGLQRFLVCNFPSPAPLSR
jgi:hypothetical protein